jgi:hypothetical protein
MGVRVAVAAGPPRIEVAGPCADQPGRHYPRATGVQMIPLPRQRTMPALCAEVPANPWCPKP